MTVGEGTAGEARVRWLVVGGFSSAPTGRKFSVTPDTFAQAMTDAKLGGRVTVPDRLGAADHRTFEVAFSKPRSFSLTEVVASVPELKALRALAEELGATDPGKRPSPEATLARIAELVGAGRLHEAVDAAFRGTPAPTAAPAPAATPAPAASGGDPPATGVDALLSMAEGPKPQQTSASAIDAFIRASRGGASNAKAPATSSTGAKAARTVIENAVYGAAGDLLREKSVAQTESSWRGLKLIVDQSPTSAGMRIDVIDATLDNAIDAIEKQLPSDPIDRPEAVFFVDATGDTEKLNALAAFAESINCPAVVALPTSFFGASDPNNIAEKIEDDNGGLPESWAALRAEESSRWLCATANPIVLATDGTGAMRRVVFGSPVFAVAAMLAASFRHTGTFARIFGNTGALKAPGAWELPGGRDQGSLVPTESFVAVRGQTRMAQYGILCIGSGRNTDNLTITSAPTARGGADLVPLPAQILTGRIVRFSLWVRDQLPPASSDDTVKTLFEQAAGVFLFPGSTDASGFQATLVQNKQGERAALVSVTVRAEHAGTPFHFAFSLPIP